MKETLRLGAVLLIIATISGLILASVNFYTSDIIAKQELETTLASYRDIFGDKADDFEPYDAAELAKLKEKYPTITDIFLAKKGEDVVGYGINYLAYGYGGAFKNAVGILNDGTMAGFRNISNSETPGFGSHISEPEYAESYVGKSIEGPLKGNKSPQADDEIMMMTGATITSKGALEGVNKVIDFYHKELVK
ncbi:electron transport complex protein RnfG [Urinicoccus massiliensis]|uniref:Ion-translocating oxidoreductase complex subunit G n=1 Tax=Urinicoccus massiliensis TaxID=1723382 RepID=A0A8H2R0Y4_9FIRM|nr:FMN-binding protein [Urinicoccus massiliensis]KGF08550.1 electron transporter RnfG [Tissierellia bacterium S5-A11]VFB16123.1 electron transport complex protein RnfG [Urinicoccus massiliensis]